MHVTIVSLSRLCCASCCENRFTPHNGVSDLKILRVLVTLSLFHIHNHVVVVGLYSKLPKLAEDPIQPHATASRYARLGCFWSHANGTQARSPTTSPVVCNDYRRDKTICGVACSNLASRKTWAGAFVLFFRHACLLCFVPCKESKCLDAAFSKAVASFAEGCMK